MKLLSFQQDESIIGSRLYHAMVDDKSFSTLDAHHFTDPSHEIIAQLEPDAISTDFINPGNTSVSGFLISELTLNILNHFNLGVHQLHKTVLNDYDNGSTPYSFIQFLTSFAIFNEINFSISRFEVYNSYEQEIIKTGLQFDSREDFLKGKKKHDLGFDDQFQPEILKFNFEEIPDILYNPFGYGTYFISDELAQELTKNALTGIIIKNCPYEIIQ